MRAQVAASACGDCDSVTVLSLSAQLACLAARDSDRDHSCMAWLQWSTAAATARYVCNVAPQLPVHVVWMIQRWLFERENFEGCQQRLMRRNVHPHAPPRKPRHHPTAQPRPHVMRRRAGKALQPGQHAPTSVTCHVQRSVHAVSRAWGSSPRPPAPQHVCGTWGAGAEPRTRAHAHEPAARRVAQTQVGCGTALSRHTECFEQRAQLLPSLTTAVLIHRTASRGASRPPRPR